MTVRYINELAKFRMLDQDLRLRVIRDSICSSILPKDPREIGEHIIFFNTEGKVFPLQEVAEKYGIDSPEFSSLNMQMLSLGKPLFVARLNVGEDAVLSNMQVAKIQLKKRCKHTFKVFVFDAEHIYTSLYTKIKQAFVNQKMLFEGLQQQVEAA